jgi:hypothetical protein
MCDSNYPTRTSKPSTFVSSSIVYPLKSKNELEFEIKKTSSSPSHHLNIKTFSVPSYTRNVTLSASVTPPSLQHNITNQRLGTTTTNMTTPSYPTQIKYYSNNNFINHHHHHHNNNNNLIKKNTFILSTKPTLATTPVTTDKHYYQNNYNRHFNHHHHQQQQQQQQHNHHTHHHHFCNSRINNNKLNTGF